nr:putative integron gene cassette protein [uncultured bacterium]
MPFLKVPNAGLKTQNFNRPPGQPANCVNKGFSTNQVCYAFYRFLKCVGLT